MFNNKSISEIEEFTGKKPFSKKQKSADKNSTAKLQASISNESMEVVKNCAEEMNISVPEYIRRSVELMVNLQKYGTKESIIKLVGLKNGDKKDVLTIPLFSEKI